MHLLFFYLYKRSLLIFDDIIKLINQIIEMTFSCDQHMTETIDWERKLMKLVAFAIMCSTRTWLGMKKEGNYSWKFSNTILAIKIRTALKCHISLNFDRSGMIFFLQNSHLQNIYQMRPSRFLYLYPFRNECWMKKTFAFCKCGGQFFVCSWMEHWHIASNVLNKAGYTATKVACG